MGKEKKKKVAKISKKDCDKFKLQLVGLQKEALAKLKESQNAWDGEISLGINNEEAYVLSQIKRAFEKIDEGTYGVCDISGDPIPLARLKAMPYATLTVEAQSQMEKKSR